MSTIEIKETDEERQPLLSSSTHNYKAETQGLILVLISSSISACMSGFIKLCGSYGIPSSEIVTLGSIFNTIVALGICAWKKIHPLGPSNLRPWLILNGIIGGLVGVLQTACLTSMPLADYTVLVRVSPAFTTVLASLVLGEPLRFVHGVCILLCMSGTILIMKPSIIFGEAHQLPFIPTLGTLVTAVLTAIFAILIRKIGKQVHYIVYINYFNLSILPIALAATKNYVVPQGWNQHLALAMVSVTALLNLLLMNRGLQIAPAGPASMMRTSVIILAFLVGVLFFNEYPDELSLVGSAMIFSAIVILIIASKKPKH